MTIRIGLENGIEGRSLAWALDFPGCFAYGEDGSTALLHVPKAVLEYETWIGHHSPDPWITFGDFDIKLVEVWQVYNISKTYEVINSREGYEVNAWFREDWKPLTQVEINHGLEMLRWSRTDLLASIQDLTPELLDTSFPNELRSIRGILGHIASAEWWYLSRLGLAGITYQDLTEDSFQRLAIVRQQLNQVLPKLVDLENVTGTDGEIWSPRKLLRRALWHEIDHIEHIRKLKATKIL